MDLLTLLLLLVVACIATILFLSREEQQGKTRMETPAADRERLQRAALDEPEPTPAPTPRRTRKVQPSIPEIDEMHRRAVPSAPVKPKGTIN